VVFERKRLVDGELGRRGREMTDVNNGFNI
jgi:hypothetical protein